MIIDTICTSIFFLRKWNFFCRLVICSIVSFVLVSISRDLLFSVILLYFALSYIQPKNILSIFVSFTSEKKINFHVWFDDIFSRCIIFYFGLTFWQLVTNQVISGIMIYCIYMYLCNNESKWETQGEIQALLIYFYRTAWPRAFICDVDNVRNIDV